MTPPVLADMALRTVAAGALCFAFGGAPLGVLLVARRMSLVGDAMSHGLMPGVAIAYLLAGPNPLALTAGALLAAVVVAGASTLFSRGGRLPEDASFAVFYLPALALGVLLLGREANAEAVQELLFGAAEALDGQSLILAAVAATATLISLALFIRGFLAEGADPVFMRAIKARGWALHILLMMLVALNLVAGFRAFGALMTVGLMMIPAAAARFWAQSYLGQAGVAILISALSSALGLIIADRLSVQPGAVMTLSAAVLFGLSAIFGTKRSLIQSLPGRPHLEG
jgi:zinc/manganese transport system permease protein